VRLSKEMDKGKEVYFKDTEEMKDYF